MPTISEEKNIAYFIMSNDGDIFLEYDESQFLSGL